MHVSSRGGCHQAGMRCAQNKLDSFPPSPITEVTLLASLSISHWILSTEWHLIRFSYNFNFTESFIEMTTQG
jgi:hypothetical protein